MDSIIFVFLWLPALLIGCFIWFQKKKGKLNVEHTDRISLIKKAIEINFNQMQIRKESLNKYDFLTYNLSESLIVQNEIALLN